MPLTKRIIEPVNISRVHVPTQGLNDELECVTNHTLANVIRQLSSLSKMAEDVFLELTEETQKVFGRMKRLQCRIENVQDKTAQLNATVEEVNLQDINLCKPYKSSVARDQQVISRSTVPRSILEIYNKCDSLPPLNAFDVIREDGKDSMKFYTNPTYFLELWVQEMDKQIQENKSELNKKRERRRKSRAGLEKKKPRKIKDSKAKWQARARGVEFFDDQAKRASRQPCPESKAPPPPPPSQPPDDGTDPCPPPPPPPPPSPSQPPGTGTDLPPPPPPAPSSTPSQPVPDGTAPTGTGRGALLAQIIAVDKKKLLHKVEERKETENDDVCSGGFDIHVLMEHVGNIRRRVIEDSEEESDDASSTEDSWGSD